MVNRSVSSLLLVIVIFWPTKVRDSAPDLPILHQPMTVETEAAADYLNYLVARGVKLEHQGFRVESVDGSMIYADHQGDRIFNPASVIKIATSLAALERFGGNHRFETSFYIDGTLDDTGVLTGNLILASDGDPEMGTTDLVRLARKLIRHGVRRVTGQLIIAGPFTIGNLYSERWVIPHLVRTLRRIGLRVPFEVQYGDIRGTLIAQRFSEPLSKILFYQNALSHNTIAERLGVSLGGPQTIERYLETEIGIPKGEVLVERASGLKENKITPTGVIMMLRKLVGWLEKNQMSPEDILPVAGIDRGTLRGRFTARRHRGALVAKTGTLVATDKGISTLAGILYTKDHGPMLFAIINTHGPVLQYRKFQDRFLKQLLAEYGGKPSTNAATTGSTK